MEEIRLLIRKLARKQSPQLSLKLSEIDEKKGKENISMHYYHMKSHLSSISESVATHNTKGSWFLICKVRPKHMPTVPVGKIDNKGKLIMHPPRGPKSRGVADRQRGGALVFSRKLSVTKGFYSLLQLLQVTTCYLSYYKLLKVTTDYYI